MIITILEIKGEITIKRASMRRMTSIRIGHIIKKKRIMKRMTKDINKDNRDNKEKKLQ